MTVSSRIDEHKLSVFCSGSCHMKASLFKIRTCGVLKFPLVCCTKLWFANTFSAFSECSSVCSGVMYFEALMAKSIG